jgi:hypothetical protein
MVAKKSNVSWLVRYGSACMVGMIVGCQQGPAEPAGGSAGEIAQSPKTGAVQSISGSKLRVVKMAASWGEYYKATSDLKTNADFAIDGTVSELSDAVFPSDAPVFTMVTIDVNRELWRRSSYQSVPKKFTLEQTGGIRQNVKFEVEDDPLFTVGEHVALFVREYAPGKFKIVGGPTGRFVVLEGIARAIAPDAIALPEGASVDDLVR